MHGEVPWIQRLNQSANAPALAGGVPSLEQDEQGRSQGVSDLASQLQAQGQKAFLERDQALFVRLAPERLA